MLDEESANWLQGILCLKGCGASLEDIREYCRLCLQGASEDNLRARYAIILKQREEACRRLAEARATVDYLEEKAAHYETILAGLAPDDTNPELWTADNRPMRSSSEMPSWAPWGVGRRVSFPSGVRTGAIIPTWVSQARRPA